MFDAGWKDVVVVVVLLLLLLLLLPVLHEMEGYGSSTEIEAVRELGLLDSAVP